MNNNQIGVLALKNVPFLLFIAIFLVFGLMSDRFLEIQSFANIVKQASFIGIVAIGMTFVMLTGGIDLSVGTNMYLSTVVAGLLMKNYQLDPWLALLACLATGLAMGGVNAFLIVRLRMVPFIVTLGTLVAGRGIGLLLTESRGVILPNELFDFGSGSTFGIPNPILVFLVIAVVGHLILSRTVMGRHIYAVGYDAATAKKAGIPVNRTLGSVYLVSGFCAALGGFVSVSQLGIVNAGFGEFSELYAIAAAVLGGTSLFGGIGSILPGTVLGAVLIQMVQSGLVFVRVDIYLQPIIQAAIIFFAVLLDSIRSRKLADLGKRRIRIEEETTGG
ncbi:MAG: ribose ABC transporter permease [Rhizobiales bacterium]|nr:ribose ABC transporter permease [Hyphomicrobiales bacterium]MBA69922.1 ribose ABC transporter permease [Hyphomicrobiales bacterium]